MPSVHGGLDEETYEMFEQYLMSDPRFSGQSEALEFCVQYTLINKFNAEL